MIDNDVSSADHFGQIADQVTQVLDLASGATAMPSLRHPNMVSHASFSLDGKLILFCSLDGSARVWDA
jgi:WD40 repeat protein